MVMLPNLAPTLYIDATPLATDRQRAIPLAVEPSALRSRPVPSAVPIAVPIAAEHPDDAELER